jgi:RNA polymerase sigma factor (sigma-70 family)
MANFPADVLLRHLRTLGAGTGQPPDQELLQRFAACGDEAAFTALLRRYGPMVLGVCRRVLHHHHDAEDAFQATFFLLARKAASIRRRESLAGWLYQVAYRTAVKARDSATRRGGRATQGAPSPPADPLAEVTWKEVRTVLDEELQGLPEMNRAPLVLCYLQGLTQDQAAARLGWSSKTLRRRLEQGRQRLGLRLARRGLTLSAALAATLLSQAAAPAAVPSTLLAATARVVARLIADPARAAEIIPARIACLTEKGCPAMPTTRFPIAIVAALVLGAFALAVGTLSHRALAQRSPADPVKGLPSPRKAAKVPPARRPESAKIDPKEIAVTGRVLTPKGKPVAAHLAVVAWPHARPELGQVVSRPEVWARSRADARGRFTFRLRRRSSLRHYRLCMTRLAVIASAKGYGLSWHFLKFETPKVNATIRLRPEQVLRGRLFDLQGQPLGGVPVEVVRVGTKAPSYMDYLSGEVDGDEAFVVHIGHWPPIKGKPFRLWDGEISFWEAPGGLSGWPGPVTTDARGRFTLRGIGRNLGVGLQVRPRDRGATQALEFQPRKEEKPAEVRFSLAAPRLIHGTVTDARTGRPLAGARVHLDTFDHIFIAAPWRILADWKGRQGMVGPGVRPYGYFLNPVEVPGVDGRTDAQGRFQLNPYLGNRYHLFVSGPEGQPYLTVKKTLPWPRGAARQKVAVALPRGVIVQGRVREAPAGKAVARARIDFWTKAMPPPRGIATEPPDGILYPAPVKTGARGDFRLVVPPGACYLLVNGPTPDYVWHKLAVDRVAKRRTAVADSLRQSAGKRRGKKHFYYPDAWKALNHKVGDKPGVLEVQLRRAPLLKGRLVGPDGKPVNRAMVIPGQVPFGETAVGWFARKLEVRKGQFALPLRNLEASLWAHFYSPDRGLGAAAEFTAKQVGSKPVTVRLARCGSATARFVDARGKPLAGYRPLLWLSLPPKPYSSAAELESLGNWMAYGYDTAWAGFVDTGRYGAGPKTDAEGQVNFPAFIPGATYRLALFGGKEKTFQVKPGEALKLPDLTVLDPGKTKDLPNLKPPEK